MRNVPRGTLVAIHPGPALAIRGRAMRTFGSLVLFVAVLLLVVGAYILQEEFANPIAAQPFGLLGAAFVMGIAAILLYYRAKTRFRRWKAYSNKVELPVRKTQPASHLSRPKNRVPRVRSIWKPQPPLPYQRGYVDSARVALHH